MQLGTSEKLLTGKLFNIFSHSSGMKGVLIINRSGEGVALLGVVSSGAAQSAPVFTSATCGTMVASGRTVPSVAIPLAGFTLPDTGRFLPKQVAWRSVGAAGSCAVAGNMGL
jgi:hypothetical protein